MAAHCGVSAACLSRILQGERRLAAETATKIINAFRLSAKDADYLHTLVAVERCRDSKEKDQLLLKLTKNRNQKNPTLSMEVFRLVADWQHFALLSLANSKGFKEDPRWISRRLGISVIEARNSLQRLLDLGLLKKSANGEWTVSEPNIQTAHDQAEAAVRENHRQHLAKAAQGLSGVPLGLREFSNLSVCMNLVQTPRAKERIREFLDSFNAEFDQFKSEEVFQLNVQFYPLTTIVNKDVPS
jgi:uncharacterized protein (TIGR02147 family)